MAVHAIPDRSMESAAILTCPYLPVSEQLLTAACMIPLGKDRGAAFYEQALTYAQSLWLQGVPAQALLLINRALGAALEPGHPVLAHWPLPYRAAAWILQHRTEAQFIGNPRRHYQHLATRMVEPRRELRTWRAWACWWIARQVFPDLPADLDQIANEGIQEPQPEEIAGHLERLGHPGEGELWRAAVPHIAVG